MAATFDVSKLTVRDFSLQIFRSVCEQFKDITHEKVSKVVKEEVEKHIMIALRSMEKDEKEIQGRITKIMQSDACQQLIQNIYNMVVDMKLKSLMPPIIYSVHPIEEEDEDLLTLTPEARFEIESTLMKDDEKDHKLDGKKKYTTPENSNRKK